MIIGLGHKARRGKGAAASWLTSQQGFSEHNFATALYQECCDQHGMGPEKNAFLLQDWGKFRRDHYHPDYWVRRVAAWCKQFPFADYVITDVRYPNEAAWVRDNGGLLWKIDRTDGPLSDIERDPDHESEIALDDYNWDAVLLNDGTLQDLYDLVSAVYYASPVRRSSTPSPYAHFQQTIE